jgi:hypothetical protein
MDGARELGHLNSSQRLHLLTSCQYADKLLSEIEATLAASQSKSPFPKFKPDISAGASQGRPGLRLQDACPVGSHPG